MQVDKIALQQQVAERKAREEWERCRDMQYDLERVNHAQKATQMHEQMEQVIHKTVKLIKFSYLVSIMYFPSDSSASKARH